MCGCRISDSKSCGAFWRSEARGGKDGLGFRGVSNVRQYVGTMHIFMHSNSAVRPSDETATRVPCCYAQKNCGKFLKATLMCMEGGRSQRAEAGPPGHEVSEETGSC